VLGGVPVRLVELSMNARVELSGLKTYAPLSKPFAAWPFAPMSSSVVVWVWRSRT
jgi:hypothetical protein